MSSAHKDELVRMEAYERVQKSSAKDLGWLVQLVQERNATSGIMGDEHGKILDMLFPRMS